MQKREMNLECVIARSLRRGNLPQVVATPVRLPRSLVLPRNDKGKPRRILLQLIPHKSTFATLHIFDNILQDD
jgi:hypothetical protein